jgi:glycosyltransferase involved in cell wall biosynthesis
MDPQALAPTRHIALISPCFNEGVGAVHFVQELTVLLSALPVRCTLIMVDDASTDDTLARLGQLADIPDRVELIVLSLPYNVGHQQAIFQGLIHAATTTAEHFVVMDADGEDDPRAVQELVLGTQAPIVLVARGNRTDPFGFRIGYRIYRLLFKLVTGRRMAYGNYSMVDRNVLQVVLARGFVHYAACLTKLRIPTEVITFDRRKRLSGRSKMSSHDLYLHAFRSMIEYAEEVLAFFLRTFLFLSIVLVCSIIGIIGIKLFTPHAIPGWASTLCLSLFNAVLICLGFFAIGLLLVNTAQRRNGERSATYRVVRNGRTGP